MKGQKSRTEWVREVHPFGGKILRLFDRQDRFAQHIHARRYAQAGSRGGSQSSTLPLRRAFGDGLGHIAVEIRGAKEQFRRRAMRQRGDGRGDDIAAPAVLYRHRNSQINAQIPRLLKLSEATEFADL